MDPIAHVSYPVRVVVALPARFARVQLALRLLVLAAFGVVHQSAGGLLGVLYLLLPLAAAVLVTQRGGRAYLERDAPFLVGVLEWVLGLYAYLLFVTDVFPLAPRDRPLRLRVEPQGTPTVGTALLRLVTTLPHAVALLFIGIAAMVITCIAAVAVLFTERYPDALRGFQRDVIAWVARVFAYHACIVEGYPPFAFDSQAARAEHSDGTAGA